MASAPNRHTHTELSVMSTPHHLSYVGRLVAPPQPGLLAAAEPLSMLLMSEGDYLSLKTFENEVTEPVHLSYAQHYELLEDLVQRALAQWPGLSHVLLRFHTVYLRPIPAGLMHPKVLMVDDPQARAAELLRAGQSEILVIADRFRRDTKETGDNTVAIALHSRDIEAAHFASYLQAARFYRGTAGRDAEPQVLLDAAQH